MAKRPIPLRGDSFFEHQNQKKHKPNESSDSHIALSSREAGLCFSTFIPDRDSGMEESAKEKNPANPVNPV